MSKQQKKNDFSEKLMVSASGAPKASERVPLLARAHVSERALKTIDIVRNPFVSINRCDSILNLHCDSGREIRRRGVYPRRCHLQPAARRDRRGKIRGPPISHGRFEEEGKGVGPMELVLAQEPLQGGSGLQQP